MITLNQYIIYSYIIVIIAVIVYYYNTHNTIKIEESAFIISIKMIDITIDDYCNFYLIPHISELKERHDLNPDSQVNSIKSFNKKYIELLNDSTNVIINQYLSDSIMKLLLMQFSMNGLILYIMTKLKFRLEGE